MRRILPALSLVALAACRCDTVPDNALVSCASTQVLPDSVQTDILFVIDDSGSMDQEQQNLATNLDAFIDTLAASPVQNDFRIGVTTSSVQEFNGGTSFTGGASKGVPYPAGALVAIKTDSTGAVLPGALVYDATAFAATAGWGGNRILDRGSATLVADFKANARVGLNGSGKEQPFRAAKLALTDRLADANKGFLRDGARLAVIFLTDEDDCSDSAAPLVSSNDACHAKATKDANPPLLDTVQEFADFVTGPIDGELRGVSVGAIAGFDPNSPTTPSCGDSSICADTACGTAFDEADRFGQLHGVLGASRMQLGSICDASFRTSLQKFAATLTPDALPLAQVPADWRMLVVSVTKSDGTVKACTVGHQGDANQNTVDAIYSDPQFGKQAKLTFQNACKLDLGDKIDVKVVCAG